jgi:hypothetical protein
MATPIDIESLTLGECLAAEEASGKDLQEIIATTSGKLLLVEFVHRLRSSGSAPDWQELTHLRLLDISSGDSDSPRVSPLTPLSA